jgi:hypothetical protein
MAEGNYKLNLLGEKVYQVGHNRRRRLVSEIKPPNFNVGSWIEDCGLYPGLVYSYDITRYSFGMKESYGEEYESIKQENDVSMMSPVITFKGDNEFDVNLQLRCCSVVNCNPRPITPEFAGTLLSLTEKERNNLWEKLPEEGDYDQFYKNWEELVNIYVDNCNLRNRVKVISYKPYEMKLQVLGKMVFIRYNSGDIKIEY